MELPAAIDCVELGVLTGHGHVIEEQRALRRSSDHDGLEHGVEIKPCSLLWPPKHDEDRVTYPEATHAGGVDRGHRRRVTLGCRPKTEDPGLKRGILHGRHGRTTRGTEVVAVLREVTTARALATHRKLPAQERCRGNGHALDHESRLLPTVRTQAEGVNPEGTLNVPLRVTTPR